MIAEEFKELIQHLASCNGNGKEELSKLVENGDVTTDQASVIAIYASMYKLNDRIDKLSQKLPF
jgi:hypothetical protein